MVSLNFGEDNIELTPIYYFINYINLIYDKHLKMNFKDVTPRDFTYLSNIFYFQNISQKELVDLLFVSESNVAQIVKRLEKNGYIQREVISDNKSKKILNLSDKGKIVIFSLLKEVYVWESKFFEQFSDEERKIFKKMIYAYCEHAIEYEPLYM